MTSPAQHHAAPVLSIDNLRVELKTGEPIVEDISLRLAPKEIVCLVGESGSGKTTTAMALLGFVSQGVTIADGALTVDGRQVSMDESMRSLRGSHISYVPQNPGRALNPALRVRDAVSDVLRAHQGAGQHSYTVQEVLQRVGLAADTDFASRFPHQLSGGQQQRVCIGIALACDPAVVVLDEPTTGLDVVTQAKILDELLRLRDEQGISMLYVTHDLAVASQIADRIAVMYSGRIVELGPAKQVLQRPHHPYTRGLLASSPDHVRPRALEPMPGIASGVTDRHTGCAFAPRCALRTEECVAAVPELVPVEGDRHVRCVHWSRTPPIEFRPMVSSQNDQPRSPVLEVRELEAGYEFRGGKVVAAKGISFTVERGSCVALVGESGSGKTTILRTIAGLHPYTSGEILLHGQQMAGLARKRTAEQRRRIQLISQNPADAFNPRRTIRDAIERPIALFRSVDKNAMAREVATLMDQVRLPAHLASRYPGELSGGERQRVAIARGLAAKPELLLCDEITSALDVSVQAAVLDLLAELRRELGVSLLFITHDLGVVATVAEQTLVLHHGEVCERGETASTILSPQHPYTRTLLESAPSIEGTHATR